MMMIAQYTSKPHIKLSGFKVYIRIWLVPSPVAKGVRAFVISLLGTCCYSVRFVVECGFFCWDL